MPDEPTHLLHDQLERLERDLASLIAGVGLLGIKPCSQCRKFLRSSVPGTLFEHGEPVCYGCIPLWWQQQCNQLSVPEREAIERKLKTWLLRYHHAEVIKNPEKLPKESPPELQVVVSCSECQSSGYLDQVRCPFCDGRGTVWVVVR